MNTNSMLYYNDSEVQIEEGKDNKINVILPDGSRLDNMEPRMMLPVTDKSSFICIVDEDGNEQCIIRDLQVIPVESGKILKRALDRHYLIPKIIEVKNVIDRFGLLQWEVITDRGPYKFEISNRYSDIKLKSDGRVLIMDSNDNRYEIPDVNKLPRKSQKLLKGDL